MKASRRSFFGIMGVAPLAAKAAANEAIANAASITSSGLGNASNMIGASIADSSAKPGPYIPYEQRAIGAADFIKAFGVPTVVENLLRDRARDIRALDPDIACKTSWSMSIKIMTQRERNYQRALDRMVSTGAHYSMLTELTKRLGFDWPW